MDTIKGFDASTFPTRIAGEVSDFDAMASKFVDAKELRRNDRFIHFALAAAQLAIEDAGLDPTKEDGDRVGVVIGSGMGGIATIEETIVTLRERGLRKVSPFFVPSVVINLAGGQVSLRYGFRGPSFAPVSACATGNHALGDAMLMIERGMCDVVIAGGAEATITPLGLAGFVAARAMSERNDAPTTASRPFDKGRDGFVAAAFSEPSTMRWTREGECPSPLAIATRSAQGPCSARVPRTNAYTSTRRRRGKPTRRAIRRIRR